MAVHQDVNDALACLEQAAPDATTFLLTVREDLVADAPVAAAQAAAESPYQLISVGGFSYSESHRSSLQWSASASR